MSVFQIVLFWRCLLWLSWVHLTFFLFPFFFLLRARSWESWWFTLISRGADVANWVVLTVRMFSGWHDQSWNHILPLGPTNRGWAVMMWPQPDLRVEAINSNYTPQLQASDLFFSLKVVILLPGMFWPKCLSLLHFKLIADSLYTSLTDQLQSYWLSCADSSFGCLSTLLCGSHQEMCCLRLSPHDRSCLLKFSLQAVVLRDNNVGYTCT